MATAGWGRAVWWGALGAAGGLVASGVVAGSGVLLALFWSDTVVLAVVGSLVGMATVVCWPMVFLRVLSWHVAALMAVQFALMMTAAVLLGDAVLDHRGVRVNAAVAEVREITRKDGTTGHVCPLRMPDGGTAEPSGSNPGCDAGTKAGDRFPVYHDPGGLVAPQRSVGVTDTQYAGLLGGGAAALVVLSALAGAHAHAARRGREGEEE